MSAENPKIIERELKAAQNSNDPNYKVWIPDENNMLEVHFSVRGPLSTIFEGGVYHGVVLLPKEYPFRPPNVRMLTPSGRFEINTNICFSFTAFHPETWSPAVGFGPIIIGLQSLFDAWDEHAVGMISTRNDGLIKKLREESKKYFCQQCNVSHANLFVDSIE